MIDVYGSEPQYRAHLQPIAAALGVPILSAPRPGQPVLVASYKDFRTAVMVSDHGPIVAMEHGIGQSYAPSRHPSYPGGMGRGATAMFLTPNEHSSKRWRDAYPHIPAVAIGSPRLDTLPQRVPGPGPVVAVAWHWACQAASPWSGTAMREFLPALPELASRYTVIGHGHPRAIRGLAPMYQRLGIEVVPDFDDVCRRADVVIADNTSCLYEFASTGRPVVVLNSQRWPQDRSVGLRFWDATNVGINVDRAGDLVDAVGDALALLHPAAAREAALGIVYSHRSAGVQRALAAIGSVA